MQPMDTQGRRRLAAERFEFLRDDARSSVSSARPVRLRLGGLFGPLTVKRPPPSSAGGATVRRWTSARPRDW